MIKEDGSVFSFPCMSLILNLGLPMASTSKASQFRGWSGRLKKNKTFVAVKNEVFYR